MSKQGRGPAIRFRLFGTPIRIGLGFPIAIVAVPILLFGHAFTGAPLRMALWLVLVTVSVLVHEGGHVAALRRYGFHPSVSLNAMGGLTSTDETGHLSSRRSMIVSLAGPITAIAFGITVQAALVPIDTPTIAWLRRANLAVNIGWSVINLLPVYPLDGGHVMRELTELASRRRGAALGWLAAAVIAMTVGAFAAFGGRGFLQTLVLIGALAGLYATVLRSLALTERQKTVQAISIAHEHLMDGDLGPGIETLLPIVWSTESDLVPTGAYTTLAWALLHERRFSELSHLDPGRMHPGHRALLAAASLWYRGDVPAATTMVADALATGSMSPPDSYFQRVFCRLGEMDRLVQHVTQMPHDASQRAGRRLRESLQAAAPEAA